MKVESHILLTIKWLYNLESVATGVTEAVFIKCHIIHILLWTFRYKIVQVDLKYMYKANNIGNYSQFAVYLFTVFD